MPHMLCAIHFILSNATWAAPNGSQSLAKEDEGQGPDSFGLYTYCYEKVPVRPSVRDVHCAKTVQDKHIVCTEVE